jgi:hypothetical protein
MTEPEDREHSADPAEGAAEPGDAGGRTPHSEDPAEGADQPDGPPVS